MNILKELELPYQCRTSKSSVYGFWVAHQEGELEFCAEYQRSYVWTHKEQQAMLHTFLSRLPMQMISLTTSSKAKKYMIIVDGKQRLTTLIMFLENKIPFLHKGKEIFWRDIDKTTQRILTKQSLPSIELYCHDGSDVSIEAQIHYFMRINFTGVPQSKEHQKYLESLIESK